MLQRSRAFGFLPLDVAAGAEATFTIQPPIPFRFRYIKITSEPEAFDILGLRIGHRDQLAGCPIPGVVFGPLSASGPLLLEDCQASMDLTLLVRNSTARRARFEGCAVGQFLVTPSKDDLEYLDHRDGFHDGFHDVHPDCPRCKKGPFR